MEDTLKTKDSLANNERRVHGVQISGTSYVISKKLSSSSNQDEFFLYEYLESPTLKDKKLKPLFSDTHFGNVCYEMFRRGLGI